MKRLIATAAFMLALASAAMAQQPGFVTTTVNLRAGPSTAYPVVVVLETGTRIGILGCLEDYSWCDVDWRGNRGWIAARYVESEYRGRRVEFYDVAPSIGVPVIGFTFGDYWGRNYRGRSWYSNHDRWGPPRRPPPPGPGWGPGPGPGPGWGPPPPGGPGWRPDWDRGRGDWDRGRGDGGRGDWDRRRGDGRGDGGRGGDGRSDGGRGGDRGGPPPGGPPPQAGGRPSGPPPQAAPPPQAQRPPAGPPPGQRGDPCADGVNLPWCKNR